MIQGFYIITKDSKAIEIAPDIGYKGIIKAGTVAVLTYFDEYGMEFQAGEMVFRLESHCSTIAACTCDFCGKIIPTKDLIEHKHNDENCIRVSTVLNRKG